MADVAPGSPAATLAEQIAAFASTSRDNGIPAEVARSARQRILDVIGLCAAAHSLDTSAGIIDYVLDQNAAGQSHIVGHTTTTTAALAALANGVLAHSLDYDDTHLPSVLHPSASVVPAALAAAEDIGASGEATARAVAVGLEVTVRLGMAGYDADLGNSVFFEHGQHATSICGALGSAVAAGMLYGLDENGIRDSLGIAASMASGIIEANRTGGTVKRLHCGWAAHSALIAAQLARRGFTGPPTALEGRFGFFEAFLHGQYRAKEVTEGLGRTWAVPGIFFKPYPANHFTHTAIDAGRAARAAGIRPGDITSMTLAVPTATVRTIGEPLAVKQRPETGYQAQFSGPYAVTVGLLGGGGLGAALEDYTDDLARDATRRELMAKVDVVGDPRCDEIFPHQFPAILTVRTGDGEQTFEVLANRGGPDNPLSDAELAQKFLDNATPLLGERAAKEISDIALTLAADHDLSTLMSLTSPAAE